MPIALLIPVLMSTQTAHPEVEIPIRAYFRYHQTGDPQGLAEAFHPDALLQWAEQGERKVLTQREWIARAVAAQAKNAGKPRPAVRCEIASLEVAGDAARAKIILDYPTFRFIDFMHLIRLKDGWKIVDKVYHREEGAKPTAQ